MRSYLFVPGDRPERFAKAAASGAHRVILDLDDAVNPDAKDAARACVAAWLGAGHAAMVRINGADTTWFEDDCRMLAAAGARAVMLPKSQDLATLARLASRLPVGAALVPLVETAAGLWNVREVAGAPGVHRLAFGSVDYQLDLGIEGDGDELLQARSQLVLASRVAGIPAPVDGVTLSIKDPVALSADVARARRLGFGAKLCIHPSQVEAVNTGFARQPASVHGRSSSPRRPPKPRPEGQ